MKQKPKATKLYIITYMSRKAVFIQVSPTLGYLNS